MAADRTAADAALELLALAGAALVAAAFAARWWWVGELVDSLRAPLAVAGAVVAVGLLARRRWPGAGVALVATLAAAAPLALIRLPPTPPPAAAGPQLRVLLANVLRANPTPAALLPQIEAFDPDVVALLELSSDVRQALAPLEGSHPLVLSEVHDGDNFGIGLYSRLPLSQGKVVHRAEPWGDTPIPGISATLAVPGAPPVGLVVAHPVPPVSGSATAHRDQHLRRLGAALGRRSGPRVLVGDLNATSWAPIVRGLEAASGMGSARRATGAHGGTWPAGMVGLLRIPIDHAFTSPEVQVDALEVGPAYGSDHRALWLTVTLPAG